MSDRKYRHRGYQDNERDEDRKTSRPPTQGGPPRIEGAPRGRGVGLPSAVVFKCAVCGREIKTLSRFELDRTCPGCGKPLHTCTNCAHFNPGARFECSKAVPARIESKTKANQCDLYTPKTVRDLRSAKASTSGDPRSAFDALFKK